MEEEQKFIVGKIHLNGAHAPFLEVILDTSGRTDGEIVLLKQVGPSSYHALATEYELQARLKQLDDMKQFVRKAREKQKAVDREIQEAKGGTFITPGDKTHTKIRFSGRALTIANKLDVTNQISLEIRSKKHLGFGDPSDSNYYYAFDLRRHPKTKKQTIYVERRRSREGIAGKQISEKSSSAKVIKKEIHFSERAWKAAKKLDVAETITEQIKLNDGTMSFLEGDNTLWVFDLRKNPASKRWTIYVRQKKEEKR